jgi:hypothetical protein
MTRTIGAKNKPKQRKRTVYGYRNGLGVVRKPVKMISEDDVATALEKKKATGIIGQGLLS